MFLPLESLYAEVVRNSELVESIQRELRVIVSGPSTLLAMLNSLQMGFRTLAIEKRSAEVWRLLGAVKNDFGLFSQVLRSTQEKLHQASTNIDKAFVRTRSIERKLRERGSAGRGRNQRNSWAILDDAADERSDAATDADSADTTERIFLKEILSWHRSAAQLVKTLRIKRLQGFVTRGIHSCYFVQSVV